MILKTSRIRIYTPKGIIPYFSTYHTDTLEAMANLRGSRYCRYDSQSAYWVWRRKAMESAVTKLQACEINEED